MWIPTLRAKQQQIRKAMMGEVYELACVEGNMFLDG